MHAPHHSLPGYDPEAILYDGCEECEARVGMNGLLKLDANNLNLLWRRMLNERMHFKVDESHQRKWGGYRSNAERTLGETMYLLGVLDERRRNPNDTWDAGRFQA